MKKTLLFSILFGSALGMFAQPTLTYENHRLLPGADNSMTICEYINPGESGENITWDFSGFQAKKEFLGTIKEPDVNVDYGVANTQLVEFGTNFFFEIDESGIYQTGYASNNLKTVVKYDMPFVKMNYPFAYGDSYKEPFSGTYYYEDKELASISGIGQVEADAWGTLVLPDGKKFNALRVKTTKSYTTAYSSSSAKSSVEITTYRWYDTSHRYPLCVLTDIKTMSGTHSTTSYQAAYNNSVAVLKEAVAINESAEIDGTTNLFPNPSINKELYLEISSENISTASISIYDIGGKMVVGEQDYTLNSGTNTIDLSKNIATLSIGTYFVNIDKEGKQTVKKVVVD